ncbi:hypothetical protein D3C76_1734980 [compost metagenome]
MDSRWAMTKLVRPEIIRRKAFWIRISVSVSILLVASSRISIGGSASMTRAIVSSCFWPWDRLSPEPLILVA